MTNHGPWAVIETAYAIWGEWERLDDYPTLDEALRVLERLKDETPGTAFYNWAWQKDFPTQGLLVQEYLTDRRRWSPYVDDVAVDRFVKSLHFDDWEALTAREKTAATRRLAAMPNPYDWEGSHNGVQHDAMGTGTVEKFDSSHRGMIFRSTWPEEERGLLRHRVQRQRTTAKQRAAKRRAAARAA